MYIETSSEFQRGAYRDHSKRWGDISICVGWGRLQYLGPFLVYLKDSCTKPTWNTSWDLIRYFHCTLLLLRHIPHTLAQTHYIMLPFSCICFACELVMTGESVIIMLLISVFWISCRTRLLKRVRCGILLNFSACTYHAFDVLSFFNPRSAWARVTVVVLCVCPSVCLFPLYTASVCVETWDKQ